MRWLSNRDLVNIAPLQLGEEVARVHCRLGLRVFRRLRGDDFREAGPRRVAALMRRLSLQLAPRSGSRVDSEFRHSCCSSIRRWRVGLIFRRQPPFGGGDHGLEAGIVAERIEVWIDLGVV